MKRKRAVLYNAMEYAVERKLLGRNPIPSLKWKTPKTVKAIDKRVVVNHKQAAKLFAAVRAQMPSGAMQATFFAVMYYVGLRPGEAVNLRNGDVSLPELVWNRETGEWQEPDDDWGELLLSESAPETGASWSETGNRRIGVNSNRAKGETRPLSCSPPLTRLLRAHMVAFSPEANGYVFYGTRGGQLAESTIAVSGVTPGVMR